MPPNTNGQPALRRLANEYLSTPRHPHKGIEGKLDAAEQALPGATQAHRMAAHRIADHVRAMADLGGDKIQLVHKHRELLTGHERRQVRNMLVQIRGGALAREQRALLDRLVCRVRDARFR